MATDDSLNGELLEETDLERMDLEELGLLYSAVSMKSWEETYDKFKDFVFQFKKEYGPGRTDGTSIEVYDEMMEKAAESMSLEIEEYDGSGNDVEHVQNAFIYGANEEPELSEFRDAVGKVIEKEKEWRDYARESVQD